MMLAKRVYAGRKLSIYVIHKTHIIWPIAKGINFEIRTLAKKTHQITLTSVWTVADSNRGE